MATDISGAWHRYFSRSDNSEPLNERWREEALKWIEWAKPDGQDHFFYEFNWPAFESLLPIQSRRCLDIGCGEGRTLAELAKSSTYVCGIDYSFLLARTSHQRGFVTVCANAESLPFAHRVFDCVVAFMVPHDIDDIVALFAEVERVLIPQGVFCFAIIHPFTSATINQKNDSSAGYWQELPYVEHATLQEMTMDFHSFHRPLERYCCALADAGFIIEQIREPIPDHDYIERHPEAKDLTQFPLYLHIRAKLGCV